MAKQKKKTIKIEIPVPEIPSSKLIKKKVNIEKGKDILSEKLPKSYDIMKAKDFIKKNKMVLPVIAVIIAAVVGVAFLPGLLQPGPQIQDTQDEKTYTMKTVNVTVPANISFQDVIDNYIQLSDETISLKGFLLERTETLPGRGILGMKVYYIVDDFGNEITLLGLTEKHRTMFVEGNLTEEIYEVTGQIKTKYKDFDFEVSTIVQTERPTTQITKQVLVEE